MKKFCFSLLLSFLTIGLFAQIDISDARNMAVGSTVTVQGIATHGSELGIIRYIQDDTGAIPAYPGTGSSPNFPDNVTKGDLVQITGELKDFNGLLEIDPVTSYSVISSSNTIPDPLIVTPNGVNEANEAKLVTVNGVTFTNGGNIFGVGTYEFSAGGETAAIYVRNGHALIGQAIPLATVNITGVSSQFFNNYQLLPRDAGDLEIADNFFFTSAPVQSNITTSGFEISWSTNVSSSTLVRYGTTPALGSEVSVPSGSTNHTAVLSDLDPATFYYVQAVSDNGTTEIGSTVKLYSTASNSSGTVRVYFNHGVDGSFSTGAYPLGVTPSTLEAAIINKINSAQSTIDVAMYNVNRDPLIAALTNAHNNGIQVRYIHDDQTANLALSNPSPPFSTLSGNPGDPLMHNKFFVIDGESQNDSWVIMGSTNMTGQNVATDFNNMVLIQDQALAAAYTIEFEEMWGSDLPTPGIFNVKFGENKEDNTPHLFMVNGTLMESYFSPSDNTSSFLANSIRTADTDLEFAILSFTHNELGDAVQSAHDDGVSVRGLINNPNDLGSEFESLMDNGVNVETYPTTESIHHKYAIIDATNTNSDPQVITGSHNWSNNANVNNDENTLIIHNPTIANIFLQEFEARWCETVSGANCTTSTEDFKGIEGFAVQVNPNPVRDIAHLNMEIAEAGNLTISLWNTTGRLLQSTILSNVQGQVSEEMLVSGLPAGNYILTFQMGEQGTTELLQVVR